MRNRDHSKLRPKLSMFGGADADELAPFRTTSLVWIAGIALLSVPMLTLVDVPVGRWFANTHLSREVGDLLNLTSFFSHGTGIFLILLCILLMAPRSRRYISRLAVLAMGAGAVATLVKMFVLRERPGCMNLDIASYDVAWRWVFDWTLDRVAAFDSSTRAFPSGNMATATAFAVGLWAVLPRGRVLFAIFLVGVMLQRMFSGAHYLSDVCGGAAFGLSWAYVCFHPKLLGSLFDRMESERRVRKPEIHHEDEVIEGDREPSQDDADGKVAA
ncbi:phosphatase PAP2 family protein [Novipirellula artificiosorum]|uniref:PAP2 superfamily protein n=1 Tax=Novipirellula artificiosorum TaxID=2528016 RepID=A0A5C6E523_9BACT|nr:phosphatase PAP2 family protein [Novipirellula artificiosorum]TWU42526.1 PAP2 superfamily protein [Novipirellula artificiosorum]